MDGEESHVKGGRVGKVPTQLIYGDDGQVVAFGTGCRDQDNTEKNFKICFPKTDLNEANTGTPSINKLITDYFHHFCDHVLDEIVKRENTTRESLEVEWHLTTPAWRTNTRLDFKMLVSKVLLELLPSCKIVVEVTEALTSCEFLMKEIKFPDGAWIITCDIGGATIDTALCNCTRPSFHCNANVVGR